MNADSVRNLNRLKTIDSRLSKLDYDRTIVSRCFRRCNYLSGHRFASRHRDFRQARCQEKLVPMQYSTSTVFLKRFFGKGAGLLKMPPGEESSRLERLVPVLLVFIAVPFSMLMWVGNMAFTMLTPAPDEVIHPSRWLASSLLPLAFAAWGLKKQSINRSGAVLGIITGFFLTLSSYVFLACLVAFFVTSSKATKFKSRLKAKLEENFKEGGQRNWVQVLCNGGMPLILSVFYLIDAGCGERSIDFLQDYRASWLAMGILGAFSCANGDTWASELGTALCKSDPVLITTGRRVTKGVNGAVSFIGILVSVVGGAVVGLAFYVTLIYTVDEAVLLSSPPQWPVILFGALAGFLGSLVDSLLGATLQFSGVDKKTGIVVEHPGVGVEHICGRRILDNHSVNLLSTMITAYIIPRIANVAWPY